MNADARAFEEQRDHLFAIAYRMVGTAAEAEDLVQEASIRWLRRDRTPSVSSPRAYLTTVITRLCINHMQSARVRRERYVGPWLPEPLLTEASRVGGVPEAEAAVELRESLTVAFLVLLESLSPSERAVLLLRDVFGMAYTEIAECLGATEAACRQHLHRARTQLRARRPRFEVDAALHRRLVERFRDAAAEGDIDALAELLSEDVVAVTDGGGRARAALRPVYGRDHVTRFVVGAVGKFVPAGQVTELVEVNGKPGLVASVGGVTRAVITADVADGRIQTLYIVSNPEKLRGVTEAAGSG